MTLQSRLRAFWVTLRNRVALPLGIDLQILTPFLARLSPRERQFVAAAGIVLVGAFLYLLVIDPLWQLHIDLRARVAAKERELQDIMNLRQEYLAAKNVVDHMQAAVSADFSPVSFLEALTNTTIGQDKIAAITPTNREIRGAATLETVELKLSGVSLRELVDLLYKLDTTGAILRPTKLSIKKRYKDPYTFDVLLSTVAISAQ
jgi:type II secretory pathway component PulM